MARTCVQALAPAGQETARVCSVVFRGMASEARLESRETAKVRILCCGYQVHRTQHSIEVVSKPSFLRRLLSGLTKVLDQWCSMVTGNSAATSREIRAFHNRHPGPKLLLFCLEPVAKSACCSVLVPGGFETSGRSLARALTDGPSDRPDPRSRRRRRTTSLPRATQAASASRPAPAPDPPSRRGEATAALDVAAR